MKKSLMVLLMLLFFGCEEKQEPPKEEIPLPSYIKNLITPDTKAPYDGSYYIHADFTNQLSGENKEFTFSETNSSMTLRYDNARTGVGLSEHTILFINSELKEQLEVSFYYNLSTDTCFYLCCADYIYADPWKDIAGANVQYLKPAGFSNPNTKYIYLGIDSSDSYFKITYIGNSRVNGKFCTTWKECCGEQTTYHVTGDFSIPDVGYYRRQ